MSTLISQFTADELNTPATYSTESMRAILIAHRLKIHYNFTDEEATALVTNCCLNTLPLSVPLAPLMASNPELFI